MRGNSIKKAAAVAVAVTLCTVAAGATFHGACHAPPAERATAPPPARAAAEMIPPPVPTVGADEPGPLVVEALDTPDPAALLAEVHRGLIAAESRLGTMRVAQSTLLQTRDTPGGAWEWAGENRCVVELDPANGRDRTDYSSQVSPWQAGAAPRAESGGHIVIRADDETAMIWDQFRGRDEQNQPTSEWLTDPRASRLDFDGEVGSGVSGWHLTVFGLGAAIDGTPARLSDSISPDGPRLARYRPAARNVRLDGRAAVEVSLPGGWYSCTVYLDPDHAYSPLAFETFEPGGTLRQRAVVHGLIEAAPGVYYPRRVVTLHPGSASNTRQVTDVSAAEAGVPIDPARFVAPWPATGEVQDLRAQPWWWVWLSELW